MFGKETILFLNFINLKNHFKEWFCLQSRRSILSMVSWHPRELHIPRHLHLYLQVDHVYLVVIMQLLLWAQALLARWAPNHDALCVIHHGDFLVRSANIKIAKVKFHTCFYINCIYLFYLSFYFVDTRHSNFYISSTVRLLPAG